MRDQNGFDLFVFIPAQSVFYCACLQRRLIPKFDNLRAHSQPVRHFCPAMGKTTCRGNQYLLTCFHDICKCGFPSTVTICNVDRYISRCFCNIFEVWNDTFGNFDQFPLVNIRRGAMHGAQNLIRDHRWAGNGQIRTTA